MRIPLLLIVGPSAVGKSDVAVRVALALGGEVGTADSMQVYRGLDIGTAKPAAAERRGVPHHMIDVVDPDEEYSVARYQEQAEAAIADIAARGPRPRLVGGSGRDVRAGVEGLDFPLAADPVLRQQLAEQARDLGAAALHARLAQVDPAAAARIHPNDEKRLLRALEVYESTGRPISAQQTIAPGAPSRYNISAYGLTLPRPALYPRIEARVDRMIERGLVEEVEGLLARGYGEQLVSMRGLGYRQIIGYLRGQYEFLGAVGRVKRDTRRLAKRQLTWFRADRRLRWIDVEEAGGPEGVAARIIEEGDGGPE